MAKTRHYLFNILMNVEAKSQKEAKEMVNECLNQGTENNTRYEVVRVNILSSVSSVKR